MNVEMFGYGTGYGSIMCRPIAVFLIFVLLAFAAPVCARDTVFRNVNVVPMDREQILLNRTVIVRDGRIAAIGRNLVAPADAEIIEGGRRLWLSPGLSDMHVHSDTRDDMAVYLANGITTIVNMGDARASFVGRTSPAAMRGAIPGPQVFNAFVVDGSPEFGHFTVASPAEARAVVGLAKTNGYRFIKVYNNLAPNVFAALAEEGQRQNMPLVGHGVTKVGLGSQLAQGQVLIAHAEELFYTFFNPPGAEQTDAAPPDGRIAEAVALVRRYRTAVGADLIAYGSIMRVIGRPETVAACLQTSAASYLSPADRLAWRRSSYVGKTADLRAKYAFLRRMLKAMADADVELLAGTDAPTIPCVTPGFSLHDNLAELEKAGFTRFQALSTTTRTPGAFVARTIGGPRFGVIEKGARADLVLSTANPLADLGTLRRPVGVMIDGRWHDSAALAAMLDDVGTSYRDP